MLWVLISSASVSTTTYAFVEDKEKTFVGYPFYLELYLLPPGGSLRLR